MTMAGHPRRRPPAHENISHLRALEHRGGSVSISICGTPAGPSTRGSKRGCHRRISFRRLPPLGPPAPQGASGFMARYFPPEKAHYGFARRPNTSRATNVMGKAARLPPAPELATQPHRMFAKSESLRVFRSGYSTSVYKCSVERIELPPVRTTAPEAVEQNLVQTAPSPARGGGRAAG